MRIQRIDTVNFGYNKRLNKLLEKKLEKDSTTDADATSVIRGLNTLCNNTEDLLRFYDAQDSDRYEYFLSSLIPMKVLLSRLVDDKYPELNYTNRESKTYENEARKVRDYIYPWQFQLAVELDLSTGVDKLSEESKENLSDKTQDPVETQNKPEVQNKVEIPVELPKENGIIQVFVPDFSSPKGFESIGGMDELKDEMRDKIIYPVLNPEQAKSDFEEYGKRPPRGIMFYGPPGCGKTFMAEALSMEASLPLLKFQISKVGSKYINETSNNYQKAFDYAADYAKAVKSPVILFIDEIDGFSHGRSDDSSVEELKQIGTLLSMIETARDRNIIVIGATNKYDIVDAAIKRRFDEQIFIGMPDEKTREDVLKLTLSRWGKGKVLAENSDDIKEIVSKLKDFPTSAIVILSDKASDRARKDGRRPISKEDFLVAIEENQNLKIKEQTYKSKNDVKIGFKN